MLDTVDMRPKYDSRSIAADLTGGELGRSGFEPAAPSVFVAEGLLFHLAGDALERLLSDLGAIAPVGSLLVADFPADRALGEQEGDLGQTVTASFNTDARADPWTLFESRGWLLTCRTLTNLARTHGRSLPVQIDELRGGARWWYATAVRS